MTCGRAALLGAGLWSGISACSPHAVRPIGNRATVSLQEPAEADLVYLVMVDRFFNGDERNDHTIDLDDPHGWHGGDIAGVRQRLDHLEDMGVRTVWLTPVSDARIALSAVGKSNRLNASCTASNI